MKGRQNSWRCFEKAHTGVHHEPSWPARQRVNKKSCPPCLYLTVHESVGEDHDRVVEVAVLLFDHAQGCSLFALGWVSGGDAWWQVDYHHVGVCEREDDQ